MKEIEELGGEKKQSEDKLKISLDILRKVSKERDNLKIEIEGIKQTVEENNKKIAQLKKNYSKTTSIGGGKKNVTYDKNEMDRRINNYYDNNCKQNVENFKKEMEKYL